MSSSSVQCPMCRALKIFVVSAAVSAPVLRLRFCGRESHLWLSLLSGAQNFLAAQMWYTVSVYWYTYGASLKYSLDEMYTLHNLDNSHINTYQSSNKVDRNVALL